MRLVEFQPAALTEIKKCYRAIPLAGYLLNSEAGTRVPGAGIGAAVGMARPSPWPAAMLGKAVFGTGESSAI